MENMINYVRARPCLWNSNSKDYRDQNLKEEAWQEIVNKLKKKKIPDVKAAKAEWKKVRDNHRDAVKRYRTKDRDGKDMHQWKYMAAMEFLIPHMTYRDPKVGRKLMPSSRDIKVENGDAAAIDSSTLVEDSSDSHMIFETAEEYQNDENPFEENQIEAPSLQKYTERHNAYVEYFGKNDERRERRKTGDFRAEATLENDELAQFFNSMFQTTKRMPPQLITRIKKQLFAAVTEAEEYVFSKAKCDKRRVSRNSTSSSECEVSKVRKHGTKRIDNVNTDYGGVYNAAETSAAPDLTIRIKSESE